MKGLFGYVQSFETAINNAQSFSQFESSMVSLSTNTAIKADGLTLAAYITAQCGTTTTTTVSLP